jgi:hypothetical protein
MESVISQQDSANVHKDLEEKIAVLYIFSVKIIAQIKELVIIKLEFVIVILIFMDRIVQNYFALITVLEMDNVIV